MRRNGYDPEFADRVYHQLRGFGEYGFPESHAASFALLTWVSSWLKCHEPAAFACALLNSQPLGFYAPSQIVQDAARHGVEIRPVDVRFSDRDCRLEIDPPSRRPALRLGLRLVKGLGQSVAERIYGDAAAMDPFSDYEGKAAAAVWHANRSLLKDSLTLNDTEFPVILSLNSPDGLARAAACARAGGRLAE